MERRGRFCKVECWNLDLDTGSIESVPTSSGVEFLLASMQFPNVSFQRLRFSIQNLSVQVSCSEPSLVVHPSWWFAYLFNRLYTAEPRRNKKSLAGAYPYPALRPDVVDPAYTDGVASQPGCASHAILKGNWLKRFGGQGKSLNLPLKANQL